MYEEIDGAEVPYLHKRLGVESPTSVRNESYYDGPSTSAHAVLTEKNRRLEAEVEALRTEIQQVKDQQLEIADKADSAGGKKALRKVVALHDKIMQLHFDEVFTNKETVYSRAEDKLHEYGYRNSSATKTEKHQNVLVSGVRNMLTTFNMVLSGHPLARYRVNLGEKLQKNLQHQAHPACVYE